MIDVTVDAFPRFRALIVQDTSWEPPYDDGSVPVIRLTRAPWGGWSAEQVADLTSYTVPDALTVAAAKYGADTDTFTRYARIFHGVTRVETYGPTNYTDNIYVALDPAAWRETVGASVEAIAAQDGLMPEFLAYLEGDTYVIVVEQLTTWHNADTGEDREEWEQVDSCGGFYGDVDGYVTDRAREMIAEAAGA